MSPASSRVRKPPGFVPAGFFALRSPLLSFDELLAWSDGLEAPASLLDAAGLDRALSADHARLRTRLHAAMARPEVREALFVASPDLEANFDPWIRDPEGEHGRAIEQAVARYFLRMAGRATPFGLCAGGSVGTIGGATRLALAGRSAWTRHSRLDMDYLLALTDLLAADPDLLRAFTYRPNTSLYRVAGRWRYAESVREGKDRSYRLVVVEATDALETTLARAGEGAPFADLVATLLDADVTTEEAEAYVADLIRSQVLGPDIALPVTGREPIHTLIDQFSTQPAMAEVVAALTQVRARLDALDAKGLGNPPEAYREVASVLAALPGKVELARLVQVEMVKPAVDLKLGGPVLDELIRGVALLHRLSRPRPLATDELASFREAFVSRYEGRLVPLAEVLDPETGIGFPTSRGMGGDSSPLLKGLSFPRADDETAQWTRRESLLLRKLCEALEQGHQEIVLGEKDLDAMAAKAPSALPDSFAVMTTVSAASDEAMARGDFRLLLGDVRGPSGAVLLGRFCHADPELHAQVERHLRAEEALRPHAVFAEIVHLPEGRMGNILARPVIRGYEIPYLGRSGAAAAQQIPIEDLHVAVRDGRLALLCARLGREVIPRLTSAHNFSWRGLPIYRFLCALQGQGAARMGWDWGILERAPFLPRVTTGKLVLARARWVVGKDQLRCFGEPRGADRYRAVQAFRNAHHLPRLVALADGDNELPLDLDNALCVETLVDRVKARDEARLVEVFPTPDLLVARGPEGRYAHELVVPFVRTSVAHEQQGNATPPHVPGPPRRRVEPSTLQRTFPPGSDWLYAKVYIGAATADHVLREVVGPLVREVLGSGASDQWFFIRYGDPEWHLRLRFRGDASRLHGEVLPKVEAAVTPLLHDGTIWRVQFDTYEREIERYGGDEGMLLAERFFQADSEAVLEILDVIEPGDLGLEERWRLTLLGMDALLNDLGLDLPARSTALEQVGAAFAREFHVDNRLKIAIGDRFRKERQQMEAMFDAGRDAGHALMPGVEILLLRSARLSPVVAELKACEAAGRLSVPIAELAASYLHMHANRLLRSSQRAHELILYDFLAHHYGSKLARARDE